MPPDAGQKQLPVATAAVDGISAVDEDARFISVSIRTDTLSALFASNKLHASDIQCRNRQAQCLLKDLLLASLKSGGS